MEQITFTCETITPMFLAGADGQTPELRPPSIKGALRFWWRALNGHLDLESLKKQEGEIFGDTSRRSKVIIQVAYNNAELEEKLKVNVPGFSRETMHILNYLSYGTKARGFIDEDLKFDIKLSFQRTLDEASKQSVLTAFKAFAAFGNLGMKMRNGFGSFRVLNEQIDAKELFDRIMTNTKDETPAFHAFSKEAVFFKTQKDNYTSWREALSGIGEFYKEENKIKWKGKDDARHAKSYFLKINKVNIGYEGQILILPCASSIPGYEREIGNFKNALSESNLFI